MISPDHPGRRAARPCARYRPTPRCGPARHQHTHRLRAPAAESMWPGRVACLRGPLSLSMATLATVRARSAGRDAGGNVPSRASIGDGERGAQARRALHCAVSSAPSRGRRRVRSLFSARQIEAAAVLGHEVDQRRASPSTPAITRSPSFSRSSWSTRTIGRPARSSSRISGMGLKLVLLAWPWLAFMNGLAFVERPGKWAGSGRARDQAGEPRVFTETLSFCPPKRKARSVGAGPDLGVRRRLS